MTQDSVDVLMTRFDHYAERIEQHMATMLTKVDELNTTMATHIAKEESQWDAVAAMEHEVWGNGKPGYNIRIDRLEQWYSRMVWTLTGILGPLIVYAGYTAMQHWFLHKP